MWVLKHCLPRGLRLLNMPTPRLQSQTGTDSSKVHLHARTHTSRTQPMHSHPDCVTTLTQKFGCTNLHRLQGWHYCQITKFEQRDRICWIKLCSVSRWLYKDMHTDQCTCGPPCSETTQLAKRFSEAEWQQEITFFMLCFERSLQRQL